MQSLQLDVTADAVDAAPNVKVFLLVVSVLVVGFPKDSSSWAIFFGNDMQKPRSRLVRRRYVG